VIKREGQDDYWLRLGAAFKHADGKGMNVVLQAYPLDGKIVLREATEDDRSQQAPRRSSEERSGDNRTQKSGDRRR
jgi:hypothetical protein